MDSGNGRVHIEKTILPRKLYTSGPMLILNLMESPGKYMVKLYADESGYKYAESDFAETHRVFESESASVMIMRIELPAAQHIGESRFVYFCYGLPGGNDLYCCSASNGDGTYSLRGFTEDSEWVDICSASEPEEEFKLIADNYWRLTTNDA